MKAGLLAFFEGWYVFFSLLIIGALALAWFHPALRALVVGWLALP